MCLISLHTSHFTLFTQLASVAFTKFASEALFYKVVKAVAQRLQLYAVNNLVDKGKLQKQVCLVAGYATLLHIEQGGIAELSHSGAVGTLHVVGVDLKHGLGVHAGFLGATEILVDHLR